MVIQLFYAFTCYLRGCILFRVLTLGVILLVYCAEMMTSFSCKLKCIKFRKSR